MNRKLIVFFVCLAILLAITALLILPVPGSTALAQVAPTRCVDPAGVPCTPVPPQGNTSGEIPPPDQAATEPPAAVMPQRLSFPTITGTPPTPTNTPTVAAFTGGENPDVRPGPQNTGLLDPASLPKLLGIGLGLLVALFLAVFFFRRFRRLRSPGDPLGPKGFLKHDGDPTGFLKNEAGPDGFLKIDQDGLEGFHKVEGGDLEHKGWSNLEEFPKLEPDGLNEFPKLDADGLEHKGWSKLEEFPKLEPDGLNEFPKLDADGLEHKGWSKLEDFPKIEDGGLDDLPKVEPGNQGGSLEPDQGGLNETGKV